VKCIENFVTFAGKGRTLTSLCSYGF